MSDAPAQSPLDARADPHVSTEILNHLERVVHDASAAAAQAAQGSMGLRGIWGLVGNATAMVLLGVMFYTQNRDMMQTAKDDRTNYLQEAKRAHDDASERDRSRREDLREYFHHIEGLGKSVENLSQKMADNQQAIKDTLLEIKVMKGARPPGAAERPQ